MKVIAIIAAAGKGERLGLEKPKLFAEVAGKPLIFHTLKAVAAVKAIDGIVVMAPPDDVASIKTLIASWGVAKIVGVFPGGERRQDTTRLALDAVPPGTEVVVIHDAARPLAGPALFDKAIAAARRTGAATTAVAPVDTVIEVRDGAVSYLDRSTLRLIQTPQAFKLDVIRKAHDKARAEGYDATDDCGLARKLGLPVEIVEGDPDNFKVTYPIDLVRLEFALAQRKEKGTR